MSDPFAIETDEATRHLSLSDSAVARLNRLIKQEGKPDLMLRVTVSGGGCSGYQYGFDFDTKSGADDLVSDNTLVPFMYDAALAIEEAAGLVMADIERKANEDLGLNRAQGTAYDALYAALAEDDDVADVFLGITDKDLFRATVAQALPDHAGGAFEGLSLGMRTFARRLADGAPLAIRYTKQAVNKLVKDALNISYDFSTALEIVTFRSEDHREALTALAEKRPPEFKGR